MIEVFPYKCGVGGGLDREKLQQSHTWSEQICVGWELTLVQQEQFIEGVSGSGDWSRVLLSPDGRQAIKAETVWCHEALKLLGTKTFENSKDVTHGMGRNTHKS